MSSEIAQACFKNNIHDFDIFDNEKQLETNYINLKDNVQLASTPTALFNLIEQIFP